MTALFLDLPDDAQAELKRHISILRELDRRTSNNAELATIEAMLTTSDERAVAVSGFRGLSAFTRHEIELGTLRAVHLDAIADLLQRAA